PPEARGRGGRPLRTDRDAPRRLHRGALRRTGARHAAALGARGERRRGRSELLVAPGARSTGSQRRTTPRAKTERALVPEEDALYRGVGAPLLHRCDPARSLARRGN